MKSICLFWRIHLQKCYSSVYILILGFLFLSSTCLAQLPAATPTPPVNQSTQNPPNDDEVLRVDTNLIQVDAIVKDKNGKIVTDLKTNDFEIVENGKPRQVDYSSFIPVTETREQVAAPVDKRLRQNEVRRTFVFIVNNPIVDFGYSFSTANGPSSGTISFRDRAVRASEGISKFLNKFVDEQMGDRDLVSVVDTEVNLGVLSSFTNNREVLRTTVKQMRDNIGKYPTARLMASSAGTNLQQLIQQNLAVLEIAQSAVTQLKKVPGRKIVVMISRAFLYNTNEPGTEVIKDKLKQLITQANQAEVTFYYLSPSGLGTQGNGAAQELAEKTGGRSIYNTNDVSLGFQEILKENDGYYRLAYDPGEKVDSKPRQINVRLKRDDLKVQTRSTVYKNETSAGNADAIENLMRILRSPFGTGDIKLTLSPAYQSLEKSKGNLITQINIDPASVKPQLAADGARYLKMNLAIQITGPDGKLARQEAKKFTLKISDESWKQIQREGMNYQFNTPVTQTGYYRVNAAVCIADTSQCGSSSQFINAVRPKNDQNSK